MVSSWRTTLDWCVGRALLGPKVHLKAGEVIAIGELPIFGAAARPVEESPGSPMARPAG